MELRRADTATRGSRRIAAHYPATMHPADCCQRAVGRKCLCKLRSTRSANLAVIETELRRA